jgi:predicted naringenin-chalcone synthase
MLQQPFPLNITKLLPEKQVILSKLGIVLKFSDSPNPFITFTPHFVHMNILQISTALPKNEYTTERLIETFPCSLPPGVIQNIVNLGVSTRALVFDTTSRPNLSDESGLIDLCVDACKNAMEESGVTIDRIGYFVTTYDANPVLSPGLSQLLVRKVGAGPYSKHVNVQGVASTAFPKALQLAEDHLAANPKDKVLICVSGVSSFWFQNQVNGISRVQEIGRASKIKDENKRQHELKKWIATMEYFLFGDGAAAAIVADSDEGLAVKKTVEVTNLEGTDHLAGYAKLVHLPEPFKFGFHSNLGKEIPKLGVKYTSAALEKLLGRNSAAATRNAKKWAIHTGSQKILEALAESHGIGFEKLKESHDVLKHHGNLAGASLPFILQKIISKGGLSKSDIILMVGYGWGFSAAASLLEIT